jgi:two-component system chemotaxis response regulator CheY
MGAKIMLVDDAAFMRIMLKDILTKNGFEVCGEAENGERALERYVECKPDLVLLDITMPELDGIETLKGLMEKDPKAKVIMCSAMGQQTMVIEAIQCGAKDFVVKPFQPDRIVEAINKVLGE